MYRDWKSRNSSWRDPVRLRSGATLHFDYGTGAMRLECDDPELQEAIEFFVTLGPATLRLEDCGTLVCTRVIAKNTETTTRRTS